MWKFKNKFGQSCWWSRCAVQFLLHLVHYFSVQHLYQKKTHILLCQEIALKLKSCPASLYSISLVLILCTRWARGCPSSCWLNPGGTKGPLQCNLPLIEGELFCYFFHDLPQSLFANFLQDIQCCLPESGNEVQWTGKWTVKKSIMSTNSPVTGGRADTTWSVGWGVALL